MLEIQICKGDTDSNKLSPICYMVGSEPNTPLHNLQTFKPFISRTSYFEHVPPQLAEITE